MWHRLLRLQPSPWLGKASSTACRTHVCNIGGPLSASVRALVGNVTPSHVHGAFPVTGQNQEFLAGCGV